MLTSVQGVSGERLTVNGEWNCRRHFSAISACSAVRRIQRLRGLREKIRRAGVETLLATALWLASWALGSKVLNNPTESTFVAAEKIEELIPYACDRIIIGQAFITLRANTTHYLDSLGWRLIGLWVRDGYSTRDSHLSLHSLLQSKWIPSSLYETSKKLPKNSIFWHCEHGSLIV
jgi:hypothetical protein